MPNHWESSARPLFVKTVFVNGSRHAILFEKDPLLRCGNSPFKKHSRPNSSLSFESDLSISSSASQKTNSESKYYKFKNTGRSQGKDLPSELQSCLVKFKLDSDSLKNKSSEKCFCNSKAECKGEENSEQKKHKENQDKSWRQYEHFYEEEESKSTERKNNRNKSCYIYNLENYKRKKNYCFVKITSQPPQFLLNCACESDWNETHNCHKSNKNNLVISASIRNLVMIPNENENLLEKKFNYVLPFENSELNWNNYLTRTYYNSLAERVFQWLDMARKQKKPSEKLNSTNVTDFGTTTERIYSGKKFAEEIKKNESKSCNKVTNNRKSGKGLESDASEEEIEEKVVREQNVETFLSMERTKNESNECPEETKKFEISSTSTKLSIYSPSTKDEDHSNLNIIKTPLKSRDLLINKKNSCRSHSARKIKEPPKASSRQNRHKETNHEEEKNPAVTLHNREGGNKKGVFVEKSNNRNRHPECFWIGNLDKCVDDINSQILTEEFAEGNPKSINNLNITRTRPVLIQNLSPQQHNKISFSEEEKIVWGSEKSTGRPQLHIFMPSVLLKDQSDDSMSECENFFNL